MRNVNKSVLKNKDNNVNLYCQVVLVIIKTSKGQMVYILITVEGK